MYLPRPKYIKHVFQCQVQSTWACTMYLPRPKYIKHVLLDQVHSTCPCTHVLASTKIHETCISVSRIKLISKYICAMITMSCANTGTQVRKLYKPFYNKQRRGQKHIAKEDSKGECLCVIRHKNTCFSASLKTGNQE